MSWRALWDPAKMCFPKNCPGRQGTDGTAGSEGSKQVSRQGREVHGACSSEDILQAVQGQAPRPWPSYELRRSLKSSLDPFRTQRMSALAGL